MSNPLLNKSRQFILEASSPASGSQSEIEDEFDKQLNSKSPSEAEKFLDLWCRQGVQRVLIRGTTGTGKTTLIKKTFAKYGLKVCPFLATTMDQYIDLVGIPEVATDEKGNKSIEMVRKKMVEEADAIFIDELNRVPGDKVNALYELLGEFSINGHVLPNLKFVWCAINPQTAEEDLNVHELEDSAVGRFLHSYTVEADPRLHHYVDSKEFPTTERIAKACIKWWRIDLIENQRNLVTPRVLQYIMNGIYRNEKTFAEEPDNWSAKERTKLFTILFDHNKDIAKHRNTKLPIDKLMKRLDDIIEFKLPELRNDYTKLDVTLAKLKDPKVAQEISSLLADSISQRNKIITVDDLKDYSKVIIALPKEMGMKLISRSEVAHYFYEISRNGEHPLDPSRTGLKLSPEEQAIYKRYRAEVDAAVEAHKSAD